MKAKLKIVWMTALILAVTAPVYAAGREAVLNLAVETPFGMTPDRQQDNTPRVVGKLSLKHLAGPVGVFFGGQVNAKSGLPYAKDNLAYGGLEMDMGHSVWIYGAFERRFDIDTNRIFIGIRTELKRPF